jgi:hypothetical protein
MVHALWAQPARGTIAQPQSAVFRLLLQDFQSLLPLDPPHLFVVHQPTLSAQQGRYSSITVPAISIGELDNPLGKVIFVVSGGVDNITLDDCTVH